MKKRYLWFISLGLWGLLAGFQEASAQSEPITQFASNLKAGNMQAILGILHDQVELDIEGSTKVGKSESVALFKEFMSKHPLQGFEYLHKGSSGSSGYAIAKYSTDGGTYRVTVKTNNNLIEKVDFKKE